MSFAKGKRIALFLDYDGTLSPIVEEPDCAYMSNAVSFLLFSIQLNLCFHPPNELSGFTPFACLDAYCSAKRCQVLPNCDH